jgi:hypothetical protein
MRLGLVFPVTRYRFNYGHDGEVTARCRAAASPAAIAAVDAYSRRGPHPPLQLKDYIGWAAHIVYAGACDLLDGVDAALWGILIGGVDPEIALAFSLICICGWYKTADWPAPDTPVIDKVAMSIAAGFARARERGRRLELPPVIV